MFVLSLKSVHDLGQVLLTEEQESYQEAVELAKDMISEADTTVSDFEVEDKEVFTKITGYDEKDTESMYYVTFEEKEDLNLEEIFEFFEGEDSLTDDILNDSWDYF